MKKKFMLYFYFCYIFIFDHHFLVIAIMILTSEINFFLKKISIQHSRSNFINNQKNILNFKKICFFFNFFTLVNLLTLLHDS